MSKRREAEPITLVEKDGGRREVDVGRLIEHFKTLGFPYLEKGDALRNVLEKRRARRAGGWAKFEIVETNGTVKIEVNREDGTITRAYLVREYNYPRNFYLQVSSKIKEEERILEEAEVEGIFPLPIAGFTVGFSGRTGEYLGFYGKDGNGIEITEDGRIRLHTVGK